MTKIPDDHLNKVCKVGQEACCRYVTLGANGFECAKYGNLRGVIDQRVQQGTMRATKDNCKGL